MNIAKTLLALEGNTLLMEKVTETANSYGWDKDAFLGLVCFYKVLFYSTSKKVNEYISLPNGGGTMCSHKRIIETEESIKSMSFAAALIATSACSMPLILHATNKNSGNDKFCLCGHIRPSAQDYFKKIWVPKNKLTFMGGGSDGTYEYAVRQIKF